DMAPDGLKSTIQSLFVAMYSGFGRGAGGLLGGLVLHRYGGPALFGSVLVSTATSWAAISVAEMIVAVATSS
ncbi:MAG: hypothetical protein HC767_02360, partial [Akkermansiaceae bacterium]|nr:hypothetical protein [Akkermansiaceae bacterium]